MRRSTCTPYDSLTEAREGIGRYFRFYNDARPHAKLGYQTPAAFYDSMQARGSMSVLADRASGAGVLEGSPLRSDPAARGAAATWPPSPRTGVRQLRVAAQACNPGCRTRLRREQTQQAPPYNARSWSEMGSTSPLVTTRADVQPLPRCIGDDAQSPVMHSPSACSDRSPQQTLPKASSAERITSNAT